jgi:hypothetical protein
MNRADVIQHLINKKGFNSYLEIGYRIGTTFNKIKCAVKDSVDPNGKGNYTMKSDEFFSRLNPKKKYDIIFIDGLHIEEQVDRDIKNSLNHLSPNGIIVMHDCNPRSWEHQAVPRIQKAWNGTVWKSFVKLRCTEPNLFMCVVDTDHGCGIIKKGKQEVYNKFPLRRCLIYNFFKNHKKELLNLISIEEFKRSEFK